MKPTQHKILARYIRFEFAEFPDHVSMNYGVTLYNRVIYLVFDPFIYREKRISISSLSFNILDAQ